LGLMRKYAIDPREGKGENFKDSLDPPHDLWIFL